MDMLSFFLPLALGHDCSCLLVGDLFGAHYIFLGQGGRAKGSLQRVASCGQRTGGGLYKKCAAII